MGHDVHVEIQRRKPIRVEVTKTGAPGRKMEIRKGEVNVEFRYEGDTEWQILAPIADFMIGITAGPTPPVNPSVGDVWFQTA